MDLSPAIASTIAAALSVPLFMALMRPIKVLRHQPDSRMRFAQLAREYGDWERLAVLLVILLVGLIGFLIWASLEAIYRLQLSYIVLTGEHPC